MDSSIYGTLVNMAQDFKMMIPLIDGHGNFGSIDGDSEAAMRYTEARLSKISSNMLGQLKNIVPFRPNFDETEGEPAVLPCKFPNLLLNGTEGIAVGLTSNIPTHNLIELNNMLIEFIKKDPSYEKRKLGKENPLTISELMEILPGPDFPTGGYIVNKKDLQEIYSTGEGKLIVRGKVVQEVINGKPCLVITEIPYSSTGRKQNLIEKIAELILNKKLDGVNEIRDESSADVRVVIECKKDADLKKIENKLYKLSPLQDTITVRFVAIRDCGIKTFNLKDYCREFIDFQRVIYTKEYEEKLKKALAKKEILDGLLIAMDYIDVIVDLIRHAEKLEYAKKCLMTGDTSHIKWQVKKNAQVAKTFTFTEAQAENILDTQLRRLNSLEFDELQNNLNKLNKEIADYQKVPGDSKQLDKKIIAKLQEISKEFGVERKTIIVDSTIVEYKEEKKYEPCGIVYDKYGYIKVLNDSDYTKIDESTLEDCKLNTQTTTEDNLWGFTNTGLMYQFKLDKIPFNKPKDRGFFMETKVGKQVEGDVIFVSTKNTCSKLIFVTKKGFIKIVDNKEFESSRTIINSTKLSDGDEIFKIMRVSEEDKEIVVATNKNYLRFDIDEISELKKTSVGIVSIKTDDEIVSASIVRDGIVKLNNKEVQVDTLKKQKRGSKGTKY